MSGVEILAMEEVASRCGFNWLVYFIAIVCIVIIFGFIGFFAGDKKINFFTFGALIGFFISLPIGTLPAFAASPIEYETHYKVTISDEVFMNDFLERYEIVDQEGKIYTVREVGVKDGN